jgi:hypothetical protein
MPCRHPGCNCLDGYLGPHCELREAPEVSTIRSNDPYANPQIYSSSGLSGVLTIFLVVLSLVVTFIIAFFTVHCYIHRRERRNAAMTTSLNWAAPKFRDEGSTEINFAPKRGSIQLSDDDPRYEDAIFKDSDYEDEPQLDSTSASYRTESSARDLMMETTPGAQRLFTSGVDYYDDEDDYGDNDSHFPNDMGLVPQIDIGPPVDEDGHELHNVDIV